MRVFWLFCRASCVLSLALWFSAVTARASDVLTLEFQGQSYRFLPEMEGARTGFTRFAALDAVSMEGAPLEGAERLVLQFSLPPGAGISVAVLDARIMFRTDGWRDYWVSPLVFPADAIRFEELQLSGPTPRIAGRFDVELCPVVSPLHLPDMAECSSARGSFRTELIRD